MLVSADDVAATLKLLIPGFIALSVFYWFGLAVRRTDWRWTLWSLLTSIPLTVAAGWVSTSTAKWIGAKTGDVASEAAKCGARGIGVGDSSSAIEGTIRDCVTSASAERFMNIDLLVAISLAVIAGLLAAWIWRSLASKYPEWRRRTEPLVWGSVLRSPHWVQVETDNMTYIGWVRELSEPVEVDADSLDIYLTYPKVVVAPGKTQELDVEGVLLARSSIKSVLVLKSKARTETNASAMS
jgi:hypothetical protein